MPIPGRWIVVMTRMAACAAMLLLVFGVSCPQASGESVMSAYWNPSYPTPEVPTCDRVEDAYFHRMVLVGDSMADGLAIHDLVGELQLMTRIGLSPRTARTEPLFKHDGKDVTIVRKLPLMRPTAVYLWLGSNGLVSQTAQTVLNDYERLLDSLIKAMPETPVYLLEVTPVQLLSGMRHETFTNERIDAFNEGLRLLAVSRNVYLLPINHLLKNDQGILEESYAASDGIHLQKEAYKILAEYLYTHAIPLWPEQEASP